MNFFKIFVIKRILLKGMTKTMMYLLWGFVALATLATALDTILN